MRDLSDKGMLDAACPGQVFTSPTPDQIVEAATAVGGKAGVLFIVKNYAGDCMNFEMAAELFDGAAATVITNDDVAVEKSTHSAGRRGVAGTLVVEKIVGAAAERGMDLQSLRAARQRGECQDRIDRRGADELHGAGRRHADLRAGRRRDGDGRRHPWRAGAQAGQAASGRRYRRADGRRDPERSRQSQSGRRACCSSTALAARRRSSFISCITRRGAFWKSAG